MFGNAHRLGLHLALVNVVRVRPELRGDHRLELDRAHRRLELGLYLVGTPSRLQLGLHLVG